MMRYFIRILLCVLVFFSYSCSSMWTSLQMTDSSSIVGGALIDKPGSYTREVYFLEGAEELNLDNYYFDIPVVYNDAVKKWIHYYLNKGRDYFETYSARGGRYAPLLGKILEDNGLPRDLIYVAMAESGFHTKARSYARAVGLWQFIPSTGSLYGLKIDWYIDERRDPIKSTIAASKYLKKLYEEFGDWELAAAAYNAGEGKLNRAMARYKSDNFWDLRKKRYLRSETKNYVPKIMALAILGKNLKAFGFEDIEFNGPIDYTEVDVPANTDLVALAQEMKIDVEGIYALNPELRRWYTPPYVDTYHLKIPIEAEDAYEECCEDKTFIASAFQKYKTRSNCTLAQVAEKFKIKPSSVLEEINSIPVHKRLAKGQEILLPFREGQNIRDVMYADLYWRPRKHVRIRRAYKRQIRIAKASGQKITNPSKYYTVQKGDSLWTVSRKTGTPLNVLINSNIGIVERRMIRQGDKLAIR